MKGVPYVYKNINISYIKKTIYVSIDEINMITIENQSQFNKLKTKTYNSIICWKSRNTINSQLLFHVLTIKIEQNVYTLTCSVSTLEERLEKCQIPISKSIRPTLLLF